MPGLNVMTTYEVSQITTVSVGFCDQPPSKGLRSLNTEWSLNQPFFQPFGGNERNWIFQNLEFSEKFLEFSQKILEFNRKILEFRKK